MDFTSINPLLKTEKILNNEELTRAIRLSISAEQDAVSLYETIADSTNDLKVKEVMKSVANEEKVHIGEFQKILSVLDTNELNAIEEGKKEVERKIINK
jgi:rubrerythrin